MQIDIEQLLISEKYINDLEISQTTQTLSINFWNDLNHRSEGANINN